MYLVKFADGCIPPNLHNASDCPSNFPTLDPIPVGKRGANYSDAYDDDYQVLIVAKLLYPTRCVELVITTMAGSQGINNCDNMINFGTLA